MLSIKTAAITALIAAITAPVHAQNALFSCPSAFIEPISQKSYPLNNASLFDGPLEENALLAPEFKKDLRVWELDPRMEPYLVCRYEGTNHFIAFNVSKTSRCEVKTEPFQASCF